MKNIRYKTFQESGKTIEPYTTLPTRSAQCRKHSAEDRSDGKGNKFVQCKICGKII